MAPHKTRAAAIIDIIIPSIILFLLNHTEDIKPPYKAILIISILQS